jgi:polyhydroxybutyrate depolymerase
VDTAVKDTVAFWSGHDGCTSYATDTLAEVKTEVWGDCAGGTEVELNSLEGFGHAWPGGRKGSPWGDSPESSIHASEVMWEFFTRHSR